MKNKILPLVFLTLLTGTTLIMKAESIFKIFQINQAIAAPLENVRITLYLTDGDSSYLPHLIAQEKGYFKESGCNLIVLHGYSNDDISQNRSGSDLYLMGRSGVYAIESAHPGLIKAFNFNLQDEIRWNDAILVKKSLNIASLGQLEKNQPIGLLGGGPARIPLMKILLKNNGLNPEDFKFIELDYDKLSSIDDIASRENFLNDVTSKVNITYAREPFISFLLVKGEWELLIDEPLFAKNIFTPWPMSMTLLSTKFLEEKPVLAQKVISAYDKAILFIRNNPGEAQSIIARYIEKKYGVGNLKIRLINYLTSGEINKELIQKQSDWYYENGMSSRKINAADLIYTRESGK